jgi:hypothetical protein
MMASSTTSSFFGIEPLDGGESETCRHHAMDACSLCGKRLAGDRDIFMYRFVPRPQAACMHASFLQPMHAMRSGVLIVSPLRTNNRGDTPFCSEECRYHQMVRDDFGAGGENMRIKTERPGPARKEEQRQRRRHEAPAAAEPARVPLVANVPVAI